MSQTNVLRHLLQSILNTYIIPYLPLNYMNNLITRFMRPILLKQTAVQNDRHDKVNDVQNDNCNQRWHKANVWIRH